MPSHPRHMECEAQEYNKTNFMVLIVHEMSYHALFFPVEYSSVVEQTMNSE